MLFPSTLLNPSLNAGSNSNYRNDIQGLRAIAVLSVLLFHANYNLLPGGFIGVDIFFVISGFLVGGIILRRKQNRQFSFANFYIARIRRIVPAYLVMLAVTSIIAAILFPPQDFNTFRQSAKSALYFGSNHYFSEFGDYFAPSAHELPLLHTWSLAIEMQFYLLFPAALMVLPNRWLKTAILISILGFSAFSLVETIWVSKKIAYFSFSARTPEFLIGAMLASKNVSASSSSSINSYLIRGQPWFQPLGLALIFYSLFFLREDSIFPGLLFMLPCLGTALVIAGQGGKLSFILSSPSMVWIGSISYSLYLWHWPILAFFRYTTEQYALSSIHLFVALMTALIASWISTRWIEAPFRSKGSAIKSFTIRISTLVGFACFALILAPHVNAAVEKPLPVALTRYADPSRICHGQAIGNCIRGTKHSNSEPALVLGDSHAAQLNLFFEQIGMQNNQQFRVITASSCVTIPGFDIERIPEYSRAACASSIKYASQFISASRFIVIAAMWRYQMQSEKFRLAFDTFLSESDRAGKTVIVLWQVPMLSSNILRMKRMEHLGLHHNMALDPEWSAANHAVADIVSAHPSARFLNFSEEDLFSTPPFYQGNLIYHDKHHLNEIGAAMYGKIAAHRFSELVH